MAEADGVFSQPSLVGANRAFIPLATRTVRAS